MRDLLNQNSWLEEVTLRTHPASRPHDITSPITAHCPSPGEEGHQNIQSVLWNSIILTVNNQRMVCTSVPDYPSETWASNPTWYPVSRLWNHWEWCIKADKSRNNEVKQRMEVSEGAAGRLGKGPSNGPGEYWT